MTASTKSSHRDDVIKALTSVSLMFFCFWLCDKVMNEHWQERWLLAFLVCGLCYFLTVIGFVTKDGFSSS